ncbi:MAG: EamA family transporter [Ignavibacteria bacterium]|nr:EamA family transporter [Ignavibacteria bacterium]
MNENLKIFLGYILICFAWGSTWLMIRIGLENMTPFLSAGVRFVVASIIVFLIMKVKKINLQKDLFSLKIYVMLALFSFVIPFGLVYWAEQFIPSGLASILFGIYPFVVIILSYIFIKEKSTDLYQILGAVLGFIGLVIIFSDDLSFSYSNMMLGMTAVVLSAAMQGFIAVYLKKNAKKLNPLSMNLVPLFLAGILLIIFSVLFEDYLSNKFTLSAISSILYLAVLGTVMAFTTYYWLLKRINVVILSLSAFITPIIAVLLGWIILKEKLSVVQINGSAIVLAGILIANLKGILKYYKNVSV